MLAKSLEDCDEYQICILISRHIMPNKTLNIGFGTDDIQKIKGWIIENKCNGKIMKRMKSKEFGAKIVRLLSKQQKNGPAQRLWRAVTTFVWPKGKNDNDDDDVQQMVLCNNNDNKNDDVIEAANKLYDNYQYIQALIKLQSNPSKQTKRKTMNNLLYSVQQMRSLQLQLLICAPALKSMQKGMFFYPQYRSKILFLIFLILSPLISNNLNMLRCPTKNTKKKKINKNPDDRKDDQSNDISEAILAYSLKVKPVTTQYRWKVVRAPILHIVTKHFYSHNKHPPDVLEKTIKDEINSKKQQYKKSFTTAKENVAKELTEYILKRRNERATMDKITFIWRVTDKLRRLLETYCPSETNKKKNYIMSKHYWMAHRRYLYLEHMVKITNDAEIIFAPNSSST